MIKRMTFALLLVGLSSSVSFAAPGDYDPTYDQGGGYGGVTLDERVAKLEKKLSGNSQAELVNHVEQLQNEVLRLHGEVEDLTHRLESARRQQKEQLLDLDRRVQALTAAPPVTEQTATSTETQASDSVQSDSSSASPPTMEQAPAATPAVPATPVQAAPAIPAPVPTAQPAPAAQAAKLANPTFAVQTRTPTPSASSPDSESRQAAYQKGFNLMKDGKYADAIKELKAFLAVYPKGEYSDNATYWLAEAYYVNRNLNGARDSFSKVVKDFPQAAKVSDAQLKLGYIDYENGLWNSARDTFNVVIKRYPDTSAAKLAQKRLDKMKQEGH